MAFKNKKNVRSINKNIKLTRKQKRKEKRKEKKMKRNEFYTNRNKAGQYVLNPSGDLSNTTGNQNQSPFKKEGIVKSECTKVIKSNKILTTEELRKKEKKEQLKIQNAMIKQRNKQLLDANIEEDHNIKQLEKQLKLNKRKSKSIPKSFAEDGLDYLLEVCDSESMKTAISSEQKLNEVDDEFEEDFALMAGKTASKVNNDSKDFSEDTDSDEMEESDSKDFSKDTDSDEMEELESNSSEDLENELGDESDDFSDANSFETDENDSIVPEKSIRNKKDKEHTEVNHKKPLSHKDQFFSDSDTLKLDNTKSNSKEVIRKDSRKAKRKREIDDTTHNPKSIKCYTEIDSLENNEDDSEQIASDFSEEVETKGVVKKYPDGTWEDIYGRLRAKDGTILNDKSHQKEEKYIPPAVRAKLDPITSKDRLEKLSRLKKQLKGLLNRLAESNMHNIASQIEDLYMNNSRNDMNDTLTNLIMESLVSKVITPERLLIEHIVLIAVLHANVGTEVGAHFLQTVIKNFNNYLNEDHDVENKLLDNTVNIISQLYNFKLFDSKLLYEILQKFTNKFGEKDIECILHILKSVGFTLRKDDPLSLKNLILDLQKRATNASTDVKDNPRVKFMLDILLAIKNNNVSKIPNYDTSYADHLKKVIKGFIRKGNYVQQLNISIEDLLNADQRGKWWVVGSAWTGITPENNEKFEKSNKSEAFSEKLLQLAMKQRMNTDVRRNIFCIIMSAEDYLDAFEKLLHLGLKNQQEREIINVLLHCCLHEKVYNPYYAVLAQKFCEYDRKYQMTIKYSVWDKLKSFNDHSGSQISNLAKMLTHLFIEKGLPISTLKVVQFSELEKVTLRFMRQILLGILLHKDTESCLSVFEKIGQSDKLKLFRESLRLFIHHFLLRNLKSENVQEDQKFLLETRAKMVERVLICKEGKLKF